jgi:hypothetical protein
MSEQLEHGPVNLTPPMMTKDGKTLLCSIGDWSGHAPMTYTVYCVVIATDVAGITSVVSNNITVQEDGQ